MFVLFLLYVLFFCDIKILLIILFQLVFLVQGEKKHWINLWSWCSLFLFSRTQYGVCKLIYVFSYKCILLGENKRGDTAKAGLMTALYYYYMFYANMTGNCDKNIESKR